MNKNEEKILRIQLLMKLGLHVSLVHDRIEVWTKQDKPFFKARTAGKAVGNV